MKNMTCPGCGASYQGRRCRSCGYEAFPAVGSSPKTPSVPAAKRKRKNHPLIGFLILLLLIWALLPLLRSWGLKLEDMEQNAQNTGSSCHDEAIRPD